MFGNWDTGGGVDCVGDLWADLSVDGGPFEAVNLVVAVEARCVTFQGGHGATL